ncbi:hypothetical protein F4779DRAFT_592786 [Xylariaceae sp. FL0662B]|nr:hypothetical protein F4779DRAFT_592786 [Xylariaceae sp. FL0662B]
MCRSCTHYGCWLSNCSDGRGPRNPSPPTPPSRPIPLPSYPPHTGSQHSVAYPTASNASASHSIRSHQSSHHLSRHSSHHSGASNSSIDSAATIESVKTLRTLAHIVSVELYPRETLVADLRNWIKTVDPAAYARKGPWPRQLEDRYAEYKKLGDEQTSAHQAFEAARQKTRKNTTPEEHLERARLAVRWGEASVSAAEARLQFINEFRNAYGSKVSIEGHIDSANDLITSGRNAVKEARENCDRLYTVYTRDANPQVFQ